MLSRPEPQDSDVDTSIDEGGNATDPAALTIKRRRPMPSGRAVVGALLITLATIGVFIVAVTNGAEAGSDYLVASRSLDIGDRIDPSDLEWHRMTLTDQVAAESFGADQLVVDAVVIAPIDAGQLIQKTDISSAPAVSADGLAPSHEVSLPFDRHHAPDHLDRGERVAILATSSDSGDESTQVIVGDAIVIEHQTGDDSFGAATGKVTVAVRNPAEAVALAHIAHTADVTLIRATHADDPLPERYESLEIVRSATTVVESEARSGSDGDGE